MIKNFGDYNKVMAGKLNANEVLINTYLYPILKFCGIGLTKEGFMQNSDYDLPYQDEYGKNYTLIGNYDQFLNFRSNTQNITLFDPLKNEKHLLILMKFMQNAIFQLDEEFNDFYFEEYFDNQRKQIERDPVERTAEEISEEAAKRIKLLTIPPDYKNISRKRWVISTNLRNEIINKVISEIGIHKDFSMNIGVIISMLQVCNYYDYNIAMMDIRQSQDIAIHIESLLKDRDKLKTKFKDKYEKSIPDSRKYQKTITDKIGSKINEKDINRSLEV